MAEHIDVFISSTSVDLLEHRQAVADVILRLGMHPIDMKNFNATDRNALQLCYDEVCKAEIFIGIYAHRYGYAPDDSVTYHKKDGTVHGGDGKTSITHWEYLWAKELGIPMLFFVVDEEADWKPKFIDDEPAKTSLKEFKAMLGKERVWGKFDTPDSLGKIVGIDLAVLKGNLKLSGDKPRMENFSDYYLGRISEWSQPRYKIDKQFVNLTLLIDQGEETDGMRWTKEERTFTDLREVFAKREHDKAFVLLGAPGSGKSTLLRHLQLDLCLEAMQVGDNNQPISFFIQLNGYRVEYGTPQVWLNQQWVEKYPQLPTLDSLLAKGRMVLLLDALNEMPHKSSADYHERVTLWRELTRSVVVLGNRVVYSCRSLDYSAPLSSKELPVPQISIQNMDDQQVQDFLAVYLPTYADRVWSELRHTTQLDLFRTPFFLKLLCEQVESYQTIPTDRAALFTGFVRQMLKRETEGNNPLLLPNGLLSERDHQKIARNQWGSIYELPERGILLGRLAQLAYAMQQQGLGTDTAQVRVKFDDACDLIDHERDEDILKASVALNVLDEDVAQDEVLFFHQLLQEFFAARQLAKTPQAHLVAVEWRAERVQPSLAETLVHLPSGDPLPPLAQTGWEETTLLATLMTAQPANFVRQISAVNLALAGRCAVALGANCPHDLKTELQQALVQRSQDMTADLRDRISVGLVLGQLGDPRYERKRGKYGDYLLPRLITIPAGEYPMGDDSGQDDEKPAHTVTLEAFQIGQFPVTNAEFACFMDAGGYENEHWWDTPEALAWLKGEGNTDGQKTTYRDARQQLQRLSESDIQNLNVTPQQKDVFLAIRGWSEQFFESWLDETFPAGKTYRKPRYWDDSAFNNPSQPVVGVTWFEARAYCRWLSAQTGYEIDLPTEAQCEAVVRGREGRKYAYGDTFQVERANTFESHIRRTTPVGIFDNATPEGVYDMVGNVWTWTLSIFDQDRFPYPYQADEREDVQRTNVRRVLRGGSSSISLVRVPCIASTSILTTISIISVVA
jgi:formylglycine-generating enzyme required for sulfatase activity